MWYEALPALAATFASLSLLEISPFVRLVPFDVIFNEF